MKVTKKLEKVLCIGLAGGLILGCLAGCGDENKPAAKTMGQVTSAPQETEKPAAPQETEKPAAPQETEKPAAPQETEKPSVPQETEKPAAPQETEKPAAPQETEKPAAPQETEKPTAPQETEKPSAPDNATVNGQEVNNEEIDPERMWQAFEMFCSAYIEMGTEAERPKNKTSVNINGANVDYKTASQPVYTLNLKDGDVIDGLTGNVTIDDFVEIWGAYSKAVEDKEKDYSMILTWDYLAPVDLWGDGTVIIDNGNGSFKNMAVIVYVTLVDPHTLIADKVVVDFSVD